jgi:hypothetical protein
MAVSGTDSFALPAVVAVAMLALAQPASAQTPAAGDLQVNTLDTRSYQFPQGLACEESGICAVVWTSSVRSNSTPSTYLYTRLSATTLEPSAVIREAVLREDDSPHSPTAISRGQQFAVFWDRPGAGGPLAPRLPVYQLFDRDLSPRSERIDLPDQENDLVLAAVLIPGGFALLMPGFDIPFASPDSSHGVFLNFADAAGHQLRPPVRVNSEIPPVQTARRGGLAVDPLTGVLTVAFEQFVSGDGANANILYRRFSHNGEPLTPDVLVHSPNSEWQSFPVVANSPNGDFVVAWNSAEQDGSGLGVFGRRFDAMGHPIGEEFLIPQVTFSTQGYPQIAMDAGGNFVVVWQSFTPVGPDIPRWDIKARLYRADGTAVGPEIFAHQFRKNDQEVPLVAFAPNGTFVVTWSSFGQILPLIENFTDVFARFFSASPGDEPCVVSPGLFRCDTGRTGGSLEVTHPFGGAAAGVPLLGDIDGDGREDACDYTNATFRCDTDHEGGGAEVRIGFSTGGIATPLLGDVDGDGRADPCLASKGRFSCDTAHDGGSAETQISFGQAGETAFLADIDGDLRAEACGFAAGYFRCDTGHNGGTAETIIRFGKKKDQALLGDFDGDGRDDPCLYRGGMLLCDTGHDGGAAEGKLSLGRNGDRILLGNLDGL